MKRWFWKRWVWAVVVGTTAAVGLTVAQQGGTEAPPAVPKVGDVISLKFRDGPDRQVKVTKSEKQPDGSYLSEVKDTKTGETFTLVDRPGDAPPAGTNKAAPKVPEVPKGIDTAPPKAKSRANDPLLPPLKDTIPDATKDREKDKKFPGDQSNTKPKVPEPEERPGLLKRIFGRNKSPSPTPSGTTMPSATTTAKPVPLTNPAPLTGPAMHPGTKPVPGAPTLTLGPTNEPPRSAPVRPVTPPAAAFPAPPKIPAAPPATPPVATPVVRPATPPATPPAVRPVTPPAMPPVTSTPVFPPATSTPDVPPPGVKPVVPPATSTPVIPPVPSTPVVPPAATPKPLTPPVTTPAPVVPPVTSTPVVPPVSTPPVPAAPPASVPAPPLPSVPSVPAAPAVPPVGIPGPGGLPPIPVPPDGVSMTPATPETVKPVTHLTMPASAPTAQMIVVPGDHNTAAGRAMMRDIQPHVAALQTGAAPSQRALAVRALSGCRHGSTDAVKAVLFHAAQNDPAPLVRTVCIEELCKLGYYDPAFMAFLTKACDDPSADVCKAAKDAMARMSPRR